MIKVKVNNEYKDVVKIFCGGTLQKEITKVWSREAQEYVYVYESSVEYTGTLPITISANGDALIDYRIYGGDGGVGEPTENLIDADNPGTQRVELEPNTDYCLCKYTGSLSGIARCNVYDENDNKLFGDYINVWVSYSFTNPSNGAYAIISFDSVVKGKLSFTKGRADITSSLYPASYIPYGYKLPMTAYKQEFKVTSDMLDQSNWMQAGVYFIYFNISGLVSKAECVAKIYKNFSAGYIPKRLVVALTDDTYSLVPTEYRILNNDGVILNKEFNFSSWNKIYLCIGYGDGFLDHNTRQSKIDELFGNWEILIAPTLQTQTVPIYIGENQLDSVEGVSDYVDKASDKIVRMIGEYTFTGDESFNKYGNSDVFYTSKTIDPVGITTVNTITMRCNHPAFTAIENKDTRYWLNPEADNICCFLPGGMSQVFLRSTSNFTTATECKAYLKAQFDNGTPVKISYWLKPPVEEDPPVSFPDIPTIKGETVIDYDGEPKPSQMYVKYRR